MKKKNSNKNDINSFKTYKSNQWLFLRKTLARKKDFILGLWKLHKKYIPSDDFGKITAVAALEDFTNNGAWDEKIGVIYAAAEIFKTEGQHKKFLAHIKKFVNKNDLGDEWIGTIYTLLLTNRLIPPKHNLHISYKGDKGKERVILELNPDTSIEDVKAAWSDFDKKRRELYPSFERHSLTGKKLEAFRLYLKDLSTKSNLADKDKVAEFWDTGSQEIDRRRINKIKQNRSRIRRGKI